MLGDHEAEARRLLDRAAYDYFAGGALDERAMAANRSAYGRISLHHRILRAAVEPDFSTTLLGQTLSMPVLVAPVAFQRMAHPDGEEATARACAGAGTVVVLSTTSNCSTAKVSAAAKGAIWQQLYMMKDRGITSALVQAAEAAGCKAIVLTVDVPAWGRRERDIRNGFALPAGLVIESLLVPGRQDFYDGSFPSDLSTFINERFKFDLTWDDVAWLRSITKLPVVLKGISHPEDGRLAAEQGAAAVFVSNHGGRQLDAAPATIDTLPAIVDAVDGRLPIIVDGGIRRGTDVVTALALGAQAVAIGRPVLWGLASGGQQGALDVLETLRAEIRNTMTLCGCAKLAELSRDAICEVRRESVRPPQETARNRQDTVGDMK
jgi:4-hydroxymandelate oxidase